MNRHPLKCRRGVIRVTLVLFASLGSVAFAQPRVPQFKQFPAGEVFVGKNAPVVITANDRTFRTRLREGAIGKPNFAGHYILTFWGCGTTCLMGAVIDAKTGKVYWLPHTICCWPSDVDDNFDPIEFRLNSKLIIFSGWRNEKEDDHGSHFYVFENGRFKFLRTVE